eukprot:scaffold1682_cov154-Skeletonema_marinoi.AAC.9
MCWLPKGRTEEDFVQAELVDPSHWRNQYVHESRLMERLMCGKLVGLTRSTCVNEEEAGDHES